MAVAPKLPQRSPGDAFAKGHELLDALVQDVFQEPKRGRTLTEFPSGHAISKADGATRLAVLCAALEIQSWLSDDTREPDERKIENCGTVDEFLSQTLSGLIELLCKRAMPDDPAALNFISTVIGEHVNLGPRSHKRQWEAWGFPAPGTIGLIVAMGEKLAAAGALDPQTRSNLERIRTFVDENKYYGGFKKTLVKIDAVLAGAPAGLPDNSEAWAQALLADVGKMKPKEKQSWMALLAHAQTGGSEPGEKWVRQAEKLLDAVGREAFVKLVVKWIEHVPTKPDRAICDRNAPILRGLAWLLGVVASPDVGIPLADLATAGFTRFGSTNLQCAKAGKAALWALVRLPGLEKIALMDRISSRIRSPWAQEQVAAARAQAGAQSGLSPRDLDELSVPTFDLVDERCEETFGDVKGRIAVEAPGRVEFSLSDADGKPLKTIPKKVKEVHGPAIDALKKKAKDIERTLTVQRHRIESFYLEDVSWPLEVWRKRYLDHPLLACLVRSLIWNVKSGEKSVAVLPEGSALKDVSVKTVKPSADAQVSLWHPIDAKPADAQAWRDRLAKLEITQPFKQAHREIYLLTDAERETSTYSNRFAAHILRQHQLHALAEARDWKHAYIGAWDSDEGFRAKRIIPRLGLTGELWIESVNDSPASTAGVAMYVASDQVRFYDADRNDLPLDRVPKLAFSEVMRDVDLFVGVASVGNDPDWTDGGPEGPYRDYFRQYSTAPLTESAKTRRAVLEGLIPRLKIADRCKLDDRFLIVRGQLRTYRIHLGSGNILIEPDGQYLCIVQDRKEKSAAVFLPFEGDLTLSVIVSKAMLLAEDDKITDQTIVRQLRQR